LYQPLSVFTVLSALKQGRNRVGGRFRTSYSFELRRTKARSYPEAFCSKTSRSQAAFFCCALTLAQRARCAAAILFRADWLMVRTGAGPAGPFAFAHRALWAAAIFRRAAAETVRLVLSVPGLAAPEWSGVTSSPIASMARSNRLRSCRNSFNTSAKSAMVPPHGNEITAASIVHALCQKLPAQVGFGFAT
jgi:hypothetical protein